MQRFAKVSPRLLTLDLRCQGEAEQDVLRAQLCAVVDEFKAAGCLPERVVIAVKQIAEDAGLRPSRAVMVAGAPLSQRDTTMMALVRWCIEHYYRGQTART